MKNNHFYFLRRNKRKKRFKSVVDVGTYLSSLPSVDDSLVYRIKRYSDRYIVGDSPYKDNRSPYFVKLVASSPFDSGSDVNSLVDSIFRSTHVNFPKSFIDMELLQRAKVGRFSACQPWGMVKSDDYFRSYFTRREPIDSWFLDSYQSAADWFYSHFPDVLTPLDPDLAFSLTSKVTNWGPPFSINVKGKDDYIQSYYERFLSLVGGSSSEFDLPIQLFHRSQPNGDSLWPKHRIVNCLPGAIRAYEKMYSDVVFSVIRKFSCFAKFNSDVLTHYRSDQLLRSAFSFVITGDVKLYDTSFHPSFAEVHSSQLAKRFRDDFAISRQFDYLMFSPLLCPDGVYSGRTGGLPSGSSWTSSLGSSHLCVCLLALVKHTTGRYSFDDFMVSNDDFKLCSNHSLSFVSSYMSGFQLDCMEHKLEVHSDRSSKFCQVYHYSPAVDGWFYPNEIYTYSLYRVNNQIARSERANKFPEDFVFNQISLFAKLINVQHHPLVIPYLQQLRCLRVLLLSSHNIRHILSSQNITGYTNKVNSSSYERDRLIEKLGSVTTLPLYGLIINLS